MLVEDVMTTEPVTVAPSDSVKHALELLDRHRITLLPVVLGHRLSGVVSEADLIRDLVAHDPRTRLTPRNGRGVDHPKAVYEVMTRHPVTVRPDTDLATAVEVLTTTTVKSVPVVDSRGRMRGILSRSDVVRCYARGDQSIAAEVVAALESVGLHDWLVEVDEGVVTLGGTDVVDRADLVLARIMTRSVPGVIDVEAV